MKRRLELLAFALALILLATFLVPLAAQAQVLSPARGGTGTGTAPAYGQLLLGNGSGGYTLTATSSLGIASALWGNITGTLSDQADLAAALSAKFALADWYATTTSGLSEGTNLYFTDARARSAIASDIAGIEYASGTGVFTLSSGYEIPLAASTSEWATAYGWGDHSTEGYLTSLAGLDTDDLAEGSNLYFTNDRADARITLQKGQAGGLASLDGAGKVPVSQLPNSIMQYQGTWDASENDPELADGTGSAGDVYRVTVAGSPDLGSGAISFVVGDYAIYNGTTWEKADTTDAVASVNGFTGNVELDTDDVGEGSDNLYFSNTRARAALSVSGSGLGYDSGTGTFSVTSGYAIPLTASTTDWQGFFTTPSTRITAGTGIDWSDNTLNVTLADFDTDDLAEGTNLYYTDARVGSYITGSTTLPAFLNYWTKSGDDLVYVTNNIGIGTATPDTLLTVSRPDGTAITKFERSGATARYMTFDFSGGDASWRTNSARVETITDTNAVFIVSDSETDATTKNARFGVNHYTNSEEPFLFGLLSSTATQNILNIGGGTALGNAATQIRFVTASNNTTQTGTTRLSVLGDGKVGIGTGLGQDRLLEVLDTSAPQLRLTYTDASVYTDFQTDSSGNLAINASGGSVLLGSPTNATALSIRAANASNILTFESTGLAGSIPARSNFGSLNFYSNDASNVGNIARIQAYQGFGSGFARGALGFFTSSRNVEGDPVERMTIREDGKVGIGTSTPSTLLDLFSTGTSTLRLDSNAASQGSCLVMKDSDGGGYSYITTLDGVMTVSTTPCS